MSERTLKMTSPSMRGSDVERFQRDLNVELKRWRVPHQVDVDGAYGADTRAIADSVCHGLGLTAGAMDRGATPAVRLKVRNRKLTTAEQLRFDARAGWRIRLARRYSGPEDAIHAAVAYAIAHIGVTEHPAGSNRGPQIDKWERACGFIKAPWCGCFANAVLVAGGFPDQPFLAYCPSIEGRAKSGEDGWGWSTTPRTGALILFGRLIAVHTGFVVDVDDGEPESVEGNTTNGPGGDQANGGIVARRHRATDGSTGPSFPIRGYAMPPWKQAQGSPA